MQASQLTNGGGIHDETTRMVSTYGAQRGMYAMCRVLEVGYERVQERAVIFDSREDGLTVGVASQQ